MKFVIKSVLVLLLIFTAGGCGRQVELDPRDVDAVEEITRTSKEVRLVVNSSYFGTVLVSVVPARGGGMPMRLGRFGHGEDHKMISKGYFGDGHVSLLLETPEADRWGGIVSDTGIQPGFGEYAYLLTGIWISPATRVLELNLGMNLRSSTATWY